MNGSFALMVVLALLGGCTSERVFLLPGSDGKTGAVAVLAEDGTERGLLDQPYSSATLGSGAVHPRQVTEQTVRSSYGVLLDGLPPAPKVVVLYFQEGTAELVPDSLANLQSLFTEVAARPGAEVQATGHTDRVGKLEDNDELSRLRAETVRSMLIARGMQVELVRAVGRGEREPLVATDDEVDEPRNRRVEVTVR